MRTIQRAAALSTGAASLPGSALAALAAVTSVHAVRNAALPPDFGARQASGRLRPRPSPADSPAAVPRINPGKGMIQ